MDVFRVWLCRHMEFIQSLLSNPLLFPGGNGAEMKPYAVWTGDVSGLKIPHFMAAGAGDQWPKPLEPLNGTWSLGLNARGSSCFPELLRRM